MGTAHEEAGHGDADDPAQHAVGGVAQISRQVRVLAGHERASHRAPVQVSGGDHRRGEGGAVWSSNLVVDRDAEGRRRL